MPHDGAAVAVPPGLGLMLTGGLGAVGTWEDSPQACARLEDAGCAAIWFTDHLFWPHPMPEALTMAAVAAAATTRCLVGTGVLQLPLRRTAAVARAAATIQQLAAGRFVLGVGAGEHRDEFDAVGAPFDTRGADLDLAIDELRRLWTAELGPWAQEPAPGSLPIWVGGRSDRALRRAATMGDGWLPIFLGPDAYAKRLVDLEAQLERAGRSRDAVHRGAVAIVSVTDDRWTRPDALAWAARLWNLPPERFDRHVITGTAGACAAELDHYRRAGADHVTVLLATDDPVRMFAELAEHHATSVPAHERGTVSAT